MPTANETTTLFPHLSSELGWRLSRQGSGTTGLFTSTTAASPLTNGAPSASLGQITFSANPSAVGGLATAQDLQPLHAAPTLAGAMGLEGGAQAVRALNPAIKSPMGGATANASFMEVGRGYEWGGAPATLDVSAALAALVGTQRLGASRTAPGALLPTAPALSNSEIAMDWRGLKLERELWRSADFLGQGLQAFWFRRRYYTTLFSPSTLVNKVSIWLPNHLIPGWAFITPYTSRLRYTAVGKVDIALIVVFAASLGSVFSAVNYVITYRYLGAPTFKGRRELRSFFVDGLLVGSRMMILANPALLIGIILLLSDRHFGTSVFDFSGGGDTILFQHLF